MAHSFGIDAFGRKHNVSIDNADGYLFVLAR